MVGAEVQEVRKKLTPEELDRLDEKHRKEVLKKRAYRLANLEELLAKQRVRGREYRAANREVLRLKDAQYRAANPDKVRMKNARTHARVKAEKEAARLIEAGRPCPTHCEVCKREAAGRHMHWDHCWMSGRFRGYLCHGCNTTLGHAEDNPAILRALADYLERWRTINSLI